MIWTTINMKFLKHSIRECSVFLCYILPNIDNIYTVYSICTLYIEYIIYDVYLMYKNTLCIII